MLKSNRFLCLDVGASTVKVAEFQVSKNGGLLLSKFNYAEVTADPTQQENHSPVSSETIRDVLKETGIQRAPAMMTVPGQSVFTRFVKLPAVEETKVVQIIQYEAQQNVPFPMEEVVWDYQLIGGGEEEELEVVLVAIKNEIIEEMTAAVTGAHLELHEVDVAPMALYNVVRYNYPEWFAAENETPECVMVLDIGARTTNLVFVERNRVFSRSIPIAGNMITSTIAQELEISFEEAEALKREKGMVGLGGAYEDPPDETQARIAKITRNVMTQLHADINRSINNYRTQRGGSAPTRLLLSGGSSIMTYLDRFFQEALHVQVEFLNPFRNVQFAPGISKEQLSGCAHFFGEIVGVALRRVTECPIEVSLMPTSLVNALTTRQKIPYFAGAGAGILLTLFVWNIYYSGLSNKVQQAAQNLEVQVKDQKMRLKKVDELLAAAQKEKETINRLGQLIETQTVWARMLNELNNAIAEDQTIWISAVTPMFAGGAPVTGLNPMGGTAAEGREIQEIMLYGRGLDDPAKRGRNTERIENFRSRLNAAQEGRLLSDATLEQYHAPADRGTNVETSSFRFRIKIKLKKPLKL